MATAIRREDEGALKKTETATSCEAESGEDSDYEMGMTYDELCEHNLKHIDRHHRKVIESEGFDADFVVEDELGDYVGPRRFTRRVLNRRMDEMKSCCELAIEEYNTNNATNLKLVRVVKANFEPAGVGQRYFITFQAAEDSSGAANYQAKLYAPYKFTGMKATVDFCRPEPLGAATTVARVPPFGGTEVHTTNLVQHFDWLQHAPGAFPPIRDQRELICCCHVNPIPEPKEGQSNTTVENSVAKKP